jgi:hypothetical protein
MFLEQHGLRSDSRQSSVTGRDVSISLARLQCRSSLAVEIVRMGERPDGGLAQSSR